MALIAGAFLFSVAQAIGAINAASCALPDVANAISLASDGDTVIIPAGTSTWTTGLSIGKAITLQGQGTGNTIIIDGGSAGKLLSVTLVSGKTTRITGIEFQDGGGGRNTSDVDHPVFYFQGDNTSGSRLRLDHCFSNQVNGAWTFETVLGVVDHCDFYKTVHSGGFYCTDVHWNGGTWGDLSWTDTTNFGTDKFLFVEDCTFRGLGCDIGYGGPRVVFRYNAFTQTGPLSKAKLTTHGTETSGRLRGVRAMEVYNNSFTAGNCGPGCGPGTNVLGEMRSGILLFHHNTTLGWGAAYYALVDYRMFGQAAPTYSQVADGTQPWDVNDLVGGPSSNGIYWTGTASGDSTAAVGRITVPVNGSPGWATNQWLGGVSDGGAYIIRRLTNLGNLTNVGAASGIVASGSNTLTWAVTGTTLGVQALQVSTGDSLEIRRITQALDQPGRCRGSQITGGSIPTPPAGWLPHGPNDQVTEPSYSWNNTSEGGVHLNFVGSNVIEREGEHFNNDTPMPGYTPYIYPHPLVSGPTAPANLRVIN